MIHNTTVMMMASPQVTGPSLVTEKCITLVTMMVITFVFGMLPYKLLGQVRNNRDAGSRSWWRHLISLCSCFSGGAFMAACLLDLLPEAEEKIADVVAEIKTQYDYEIDYPVAQLVFSCGFFLILVTEQVVLSLQEGWATEAAASEREPLLAGGGAASYQSTQHTHTHNDHQHHPAISGVSAEVHHHHDGHSHSHAAHSVLQHSTLRSLMLLVALTFHSVFEGNIDILTILLISLECSGIAIGVQDTSGQLLTIFTAVMSHKALMAFSLGLNIAQSDLNIRSFIISNIVFSLAGPIGIGIGIGISDLPPSLPSDICNGVLQGIIQKYFCINWCLSGSYQSSKRRI